MQVKFKLLKKEHEYIEDAIWEFPSFTFEQSAKLQDFGADDGDVTFVQSNDLNNYSKNVNVICHSFTQNKTIELSYDEYLYYLCEFKKLLEKFDSNLKGKYDFYIDEFKKKTGVTKPARRKFFIF